MALEVTKTGVRIGGLFETEQEAQEYRAKHLVENCEIVPEGHKLMTLGAHTGHTWKVIAYCENEQIASEIARALERSRVHK